jgi:acetyl esterase/lipase
MDGDDYARLPNPGPDEVIRYGELRQQIGHLRMPADEGLVPIAIVIHGGCWLSDFDLTGTSAMSAALTARGIATWNIEYRRLGNRGGGWPGSFEDVATATDHLRELAVQYPIDLDRIIAIGHSAGAQLAMWLAARRKLPPSAPGATDPLPIHGVVSLAGVTDLVNAERFNVCGSSVRRLLRGSPEREPERYALTSPANLLPLGVPQILFHGSRDPVVRPVFSSAYVVAAQKAGDMARFVELEAAGHFEPVSPRSAVWPKIEDRILDFLGKLAKSR